MLQELSVVEQRYLAVREVLDGGKVTDVATRYGVAGVPCTAGWSATPEEHAPRRVDGCADDG